MTLCNCKVYNVMIDTHLHCIMITKMRLSSVSITSHSSLFPPHPMVITFKDLLSATLFIYLFIIILRERTHMSEQVCVGCREGWGEAEEEGERIFLLLFGWFFVLFF